jgi:LysR family hydrogen peroxide-inducible transcriptional activator
MNVQQIEYAIAVGKLHSFGKAAEKCFVTQSTLSTMVSRFENEIGVKLFDRSTKPITTTREGKKVLQQLRIIVKELDNLTEVVSELKGVLSGELRIGVIPTVSPYLLPLFLNDFIQKYPKIYFEISEITTGQIIHDLENRELDIGILSTPLNHPGLIETWLYNEPFLLFDRGHHTLGNSIAVSEIDCNRLWLLNEGHCLRTQIETICDLQKKRNNDWNLEYKSGTIDTLMRFVKKNKAVTLLPFLATLDFLEEDLKYLRQLKPPQPVRAISLVVHKHFVKKGILDSLTAAIQDVVKPLLADNSEEWLVAPL